MSRRKDKGQTAAEAVAVVLKDAGASFRGVGFRRLDLEAQRLLMDLEDATVHMRHLDDERRRLVNLLRDHSASWHQIGLALSTTGDAARRRYGFGQEDEDL